jgi:hypothetical protein
MSNVRESTGIYGGMDLRKEGRKIISFSFQKKGTWLTP